MLPCVGSANVDLVRSTLAEWERADFHSVAWADPDIEYVVIGGPEPGAWRGPSEMAASVRDFMGAWDNYGIEAEDIRAVDDDRVLALVRLSGRGKTSGLDISETGANGAQVWHVPDGRVVALRLYWDRRQALTELDLPG
jgi:ketosteroid isomerase-like protein